MRAAFEVASLADMEARLKRFGVEYHKFIVPGTNAAQIFLWDPEGCATTARAGAQMQQHADDRHQKLETSKAPN